MGGVQGFWGHPKPRQGERPLDPHLGGDSWGTLDFAEGT